MMNATIGTIDEPRDGFDGALIKSAGAINGVLIKFDNGDLTTKDGTLVQEELFAVDRSIIDQHWKNSIQIETIVLAPGDDMPDIGTINAEFPEKEWDIGPFGPKPPWQRQYSVYLLDHETGGMFTSINGTFGQQRAFEALRGKVSVMRRLKGASVVPVVKLSSASMKTKFGVKERPKFEVIRLVYASGHAICQTKLLAPVKELTSAELIDDQIPF